MVLFLKNKLITNAKSANLVFLAVDSPFYSLKSYYKMTSTYLTNEYEESEACATRSAMWSIDHNAVYKRSLEILFPYSFVMLLFAHVETSFSAVCGLIKEQRNLPFSIEVFNRGLSNRVKSFFGGFKLEGIHEEDIREISVFAKIRNNLVHENGFIAQDKVKFLNLVKQQKGLLLDFDKSRIIIEMKYCQDRLKYFHNLFERIFEENGLTDF
jgi:hypothetical protein